MQKEKQAIKNRIVGHGEEPLDNIVFNPFNWRIHPKAQQDGLAGVLADVGWVQDVIINKRTGHLVDGHLRVQLADRNGDKTIPVVYVDLSEQEEAEVLATLDPIGAMAAADKSKLDELMREIETGNAEVQKLLAEMAEREGVISNDLQRPEFGQLIDTFGHNRGISPKDENWFYVEFYGDDETFAALTEQLGPALKGKHELESEAFRKMVENAP